VVEQLGPGDSRPRNEPSETVVLTDYFPEHRSFPRYKLMNEEDLQDVRLIRELGQEDDINDLDDNEDNYNNNRKQLKDDLLFAIQGFGGIQRINKDGMKIDAYIKGKHC